jgi:hypothetical protein
MRILIRISALLAIFAGAPAMAQGTTAQRAACEDDAKRLCQAQIPDVLAIEACLKAFAAEISGSCRTELGVAEPQAAATGKKHKK